MSIKVTCQCGKVYTVADSAAGKTGTCKECGRKFKIKREKFAKQPKAAVADKAVKSPLSKYRWIMAGGVAIVLVIAATIIFAGSGEPATQKNVNASSQAKSSPTIPPVPVTETKEESTSKAQSALERFIQACKISDEDALSKMCFTGSYMFLDDGKILGLKNYSLDKQDITLFASASKWIEDNAVEVENIGKGKFRHVYVMKSELEDYNAKKPMAKKIIAKTAEFLNSIQSSRHYFGGLSEADDIRSDLLLNLNAGAPDSEHYKITNAYLSFIEKVSKILFTMPELYKQKNVEVNEQPFLKWYFSDVNAAEKFRKAVPLKMMAKFTGNYLFDKITGICDLSVQTKKGATAKNRYQVEMLRFRNNSFDTGWLIVAVEKLKN